MNTCKECNYWAPEASAAKTEAEMGECDVLSHNVSDIDEDYVLPVLKGKSEKVNNAEFLTASNFGCNQFTQAR